MKKNSENKIIYGIAGISKIIIVFLTLVNSAMINRSLGVTLKGEYAYINNIVSILVPIISFGIGQTYASYRRKYGKKCLNTFVALTLLQAFISFLRFYHCIFAKS